MAIRELSSWSPRSIEAPYVTFGGGAANRLENLRRLLEWGYGYRSPVHSAQRFTRRSPSAGAVYPTEVLVLLHMEGAWRLLYYDYVEHEFYELSAPRADEAARLLGIDVDSEAILLVSVLSRTLSRYGVRGYRYCLLDAAHVASNLIATVHPYQAEWKISACIPGRGLDAMLPLEKGEPCVVALLSRAEAMRDYLPMPRIPSSPTVADHSGVPGPGFGSVMRRATSLHRSTSPETCEEVSIPDFQSNRSCECPSQWADARFSAKGFGATPVSPEQYWQMKRVCLENLSPRCRNSPQLVAFGVLLRVKGLARGIVQLDPQCDREIALYGDANVEQLSELLFEVTQNQSIVKGCAFCLVLGARESELRQMGSPSYRRAFLNAGCVCADLYREAIRCSIGTTTIGGFWDRRVRSMLGNAPILPLVMQAFGCSALDGEKLDEFVMRSRYSIPRTNQT